MAAAGVILLTVWAGLPAQTSRRAQTSKGPRALGLIELSPDGKQQLIPIAIMVNGKFYDASAYKADPVPMALEPQTVYEGVKAGVSQGLFTVTTPGQKGGAWVGLGVWEAAGAHKTTAIKETAGKPREDPDAPPILRRGAPKPKTEEPAPPVVPTEEKKPEEKKSDTSASAPSAPAPPAASPAPTSAPAPPAEEDSNRPILRRGKPVPPPPQKTPAPAPTAGKSPAPSLKAGSAKMAAPEKKGSQKSETLSQARFIAAISDADGPEFNPYSLDVKPEETEDFRKKMLAMAVAELGKRGQQIQSAEPKKPARTAKPARAPQPQFEDVQLRVFDVANSNEPILVLSANGHVDAPDGASATFYVTLVARSDINGELRKLFSQVTDTRHLDAIPRLELIDVVDADGDGRGDVLFREVSDTSQGYVVYRVSADVLWKLYDSLGR